MADPRKPQPTPNSVSQYFNTITNKGFAKPGLDPAVRKIISPIPQQSNINSGGVSPTQPNIPAWLTAGIANPPVWGKDAARFVAPTQSSATGQTAAPTGQAGAWSTNYGTTAETERARLLASQQLPSQVTGGFTGGTMAAPQGFTADDLYIDPTAAYQPVLDQYAAQQAQLQDRYGQNAADIKNIFGNLSTVRALDKTKIAQQYQTSIQQQQDALAARTAETRMNTQAGQQGAATAAGEMGTEGQPVPTDSLTAQAAEQGVADSNAYQTTWAALQNVMSQQAQNDVQNAVQGYDYQQMAGLEQLRNNLEDRLASIQGNVAGTQSQLAQAKLEGQQNVANAKYSEAQARQQAAASAANSAANAANKPKTYSKDVYGWKNRVTDAGKDTTGIINSINQAATAELRAQKAKGVQNPKLSKSTLQNRWLVMFQGDPSTEFAIDYIKNYSGYGN